MRVKHLILAAGFGGVLVAGLMAGLEARRLMGRLAEVHRKEREQVVAHAKTLYALHRLQDAAEPITRFDTGMRAQLLGEHREMEAAVTQLPQEDVMHRTVMPALDQRRAAIQLGEPGGVRAAGERIKNAVLAAELAHAREVEAGQIAVKEEFESVRRRASRYLTLAILAGAVLAMVSVIAVGKLEREEEERQRQMEQLSRRMLEAQEQERRSLSRELHDSLGQALGVIAMDAGRLAKELPETQGPLRRLAEGIQKQAERVLSSMREIALMLRPSMLDDLGLGPAIEWLGREVSRRGGLQVEVDCDGVPEELRDEVGTCLFRVAQEALSNAERHSGGRTARVRLRRDGRELRLSVEDDGQGFAARKVKGLGLLGMEERVRQLGGWLQVDSGKGRGTAVHAGVPL